MRFTEHAWQSPATAAVMPVRRFGLSGEALLYLPSSGGDHREFEGYGMHRDVAPWARAGRVQCFTPDGYGYRTLFATDLAPRERIARYAHFERYLTTELVPWIRSTTGRERLVVVGASYGAFVAANLLFKRYANVDLVCGLGGVYEMWHRLDGYHDDDVYFHTPLEYLPRLDDEQALAAIRRTRGLTLYAAAADPWLGETQQLAQVLREKGLPHRVRVWPSPADHHERWWRRQLREFLSETFGAL